MTGTASSSRTVIRPADTSDLDGVAQTLAHAFAGDPLIDVIVPTSSRRHDRLVALFRSEARVAIDNVTVATVDDDIVGAAIWLPPSRGRTNPWRALVSVVDVVRAVGRGVVHAQRSFRLLESHHPKSPPHWYLQTIGVSRPGLGVGGALLRDGLDTVDATRMPVYLESSAPGNVAIYERFGFRVIGEIALPDGGPVLPTMWRDPVGE